MTDSKKAFVGLALSLSLHALVLVLASTHLGARTDRPEPSPREQTITLLAPAPPELERSPPTPEPPPVAAAARAVKKARNPVPEVSAAAAPTAPHAPASMAAPPAPTAEEWAFASTYKLKNSKGYRHTWGQQVRSMMGTAVEGPDQGMVRFRVEISPDGSLAALDTLWSTSAKAERLAREAIHSMPRWPPTPTGKPLIFEKTIAFSPFATDGPPLYRDDCLPDPRAFSNAFAWDGRSSPVQAPVDVADVAEKADPQSLEDCRKQLPKDTIDAELARDQRQMDQWGWNASQLGR